MSEVPVVLRLTGQQHRQLRRHLFPGDALEAAAALLCGRRAGEHRHALCTHRVVPIPHDACERRPDSIHWPVEALLPTLADAGSKGMAVVKVHSHPTGFPRFSGLDDMADCQLFPGLHSYLEDGHPLVSAIMLPDGRLIARTVAPTGTFGPVRQITVAGHDIQVWTSTAPRTVGGDESLRTRQAFGDGTTDLLGRLSIAVVGVSGTGAPITDQLARLGVGELVLVDPDIIETKNLNRIPNAFATDAVAAKPKVEVQANAIQRMGLGTRVTPIQADLSDAQVVLRVAECDIVIGAMDSIDGRHLLNKLASTYVLPYVDVGVRLDADGKGGVSGVMGSVHYLQPDGSSLLSRHVYTLDEYRAAAMHRSDPETYAALRREKYIRGVEVERPAVVSLNTLMASMAVMELLARLHPYRDTPNAELAQTTITHVSMGLISEPESACCPVVTRTLGRGDMEPLLDMPELDCPHNACAGAPGSGNAPASSDQL